MLPLFYIRIAIYLALVNSKCSMRPGASHLSHSLLYQLYHN